MSKVDLVHGPNYFLPGWAERGVVTIHDLSVFRFPDTHPPERIADFERRFESTLRQSDHLITDCEAIRREVIDFTGFTPERVTAVPLGVAPSFRPMMQEERAPTLTRLGLPIRGYGLTVSSLEPRKRIGSLLRAWGALPGKLRETYPLVIAGASGWMNEQLRDEVDVAARAGWVIPLSFVQESDLPALYSGARTFAYPSKYEGFGLPPLEAMASGVPTIVAEEPCLREVTAGAALLVDPEDERAFTHELARSLEDEGWRARTISFGVQVAGSYTWKRCVVETIDVYQRLIAR